MALSEIKRWEGKVAIVTGASAGIGAAIAESLVDSGMIVVGVARRVELIKARAKYLIGRKGQLHGVQADISKEEDILRVFEWTTKKLGPVHILVNNAGTAKYSNLTEGQLADWKSVFDLNVLSLCIATREAVQIMKNNNIKGHIININSILGHQVLPFPNLNVLPASKFAVTALTESLRQELNSIGSKIRSISPGLVKTSQDSIPENLKKLFATEPSLTGEDVAQAVLYAISTPEHVQIHELTLGAI